MANEQNLIPGAHKLTVEEASRGGIASGKKRRLQGAIERALEAKTPEEDYRDLFKRFGIEDDGSKTFASAVACAIVNKASNGDLYAFALVRDTIGEKPKDEIEHSGGVVFLSGEDDISD